MIKKNIFLYLILLYITNNSKDYHISRTKRPSVGEKTNTPNNETNETNTDNSKKTNTDNNNTKQSTKKKKSWIESILGSFINIIEKQPLIGVILGIAVFKFSKDGIVKLYQKIKSAFKKNKGKELDTKEEETTKKLLAAIEQSTLLEKNNKEIAQFSHDIIIYSIEHTQDIPSLIEINNSIKKELAKQKNNDLPINKLLNSAKDEIKIKIKELIKKKFTKDNNTYYTIEEIKNIINKKNLQDNKKNLQNNEAMNLFFSENKNKYLENIITNEDINNFYITNNNTHKETFIKNLHDRITKIIES